MTKYFRNLWHDQLVQNKYNPDYYREVALVLNSGKKAAAFRNRTDVQAIDPTKPYRKQKFSASQENYIEATAQLIAIFKELQGLASVLQDHTESINRLDKLNDARFEYVSVIRDKRRNEIAQTIDSGLKQVEKLFLIEK